VSGTLEGRDEGCIVKLQKEHKDEESVSPEKKSGRKTTAFKSVFKLF